MSYFEDVNSEALDVSILKKKTKPDVVNATKKPAEALSAISESQGWTSKQSKKPGPKRREARTVLTMNGPNRVLDAFRAYADDLEVSQWKALEHMMKELKII